jgi:hypothetical protein
MNPAISSVSRASSRNLAALPLVFFLLADAN